MLVEHLQQILNRESTRIGRRLGELEQPPSCSGPSNGRQLVKGIGYAAKSLLVQSAVKDTLGKQ